MDSKSDDEDTDKTLDVEFRRILRVIKIYIPCIMNINYLTSYRIWLEKLSEIDSSEKEERNRYLLELGRQIQDGVLEAPFTQPPLRGPLPPFKDVLRINKSSEQPYLVPEASPVKQSANENVKQQEVFIQKTVSNKEKQNQEQMQFENYYLQDLSKNNDLPRYGDKMREKGKAMLNSPPTVQRLRKSHKKCTQNTVIKKDTVIDDSSKFPETPEVVVHETEEIYFSNSPKNQQRYPTNNTYLQHQQQQNTPYYQQLPEQAENVVYYEAQEPESLYLTIPEAIQDSAPQKLLKSMPQQHNQNQGDDSSWCDLSEITKTVSNCKLESGDSARSLEYPEIQTVTRNITNKVCDNTISELMNIITELKRHNVTLSAKAEIVIHNLSEEIRLLKHKVQKFGDMKMAIKHNQLNDTSSQWQAVVDTINKRLFDAHSQNTELTNEITDLKQKLDEFTVQKQQELAVVRQRLSELYNKEIDMLKKNYVRHIVDIENKFTNILIEKETIFNKKLNDLRDIYDRKISDASKGIYP